MQTKVLVADDEHTIRTLLKTEFETANFLVDLAADGQEAANLCDSRTYDAAVLDISMPGLSGLEVLDRIKRRGGGTVVIMMTAYGSIDGAVAAIKRQADDYIAKPFDPPDLIEKVQQILRFKRRIAQLGAGGTVGASTLLGKSAAMEQIRATVSKVKDRNTTVLITGESGTGKGVVARYIHLNSNRRELPFVHIDCASLPHNLIESELFGHEKGAFTSANAPKKGKLELAGQGTVFLDEIATLPPELQSKLLIVLQERYFEHIGGTQKIPLEARVITATNED